MKAVNMHLSKACLITGREEMGPNLEIKSSALFEDILLENKACGRGGGENPMLHNYTIDWEIFDIKHFRQ